MRLVIDYLPLMQILSKIFQIKTKHIGFCFLSYQSNLNDIYVQNFIVICIFATKVTTISIKFGVLINIKISFIKMGSYALNIIWWLCLVPTSTTRFASGVGYRMAKKGIGLYKEIFFMNNDI